MANISKIKVPNDSTTYNIHDTAAITSLKTVNNTSLEGSGDVTPSSGSIVWFGTCDTAVGTAVKVVTTTTGDFSLTNGNILKVKFLNGNTASTIGLEVDNNNSKTVKISTNSSNTYRKWAGGEIVDFVYYNSNFYLTSNPQASGYDSSSVPSLGSARLSNSYSDTATDSIPTANALKGVYDIIKTKMISSSPTSTILSVNTTYFNLYDNAYLIKLKVWNGIADLTGIVKPKSTITGSDTQYTICTIPDGYRPEIGLVEPMQGTSQGIWMCRVHGANDGDDGAVTFSRYRTANAWADVSTSTWLPFHMIWVVPQS